MSKGYRKLDPALKTRALELRNQGKSNGEIGRELGVSHVTIWSWLGPIKSHRPKVTEQH